MIDRNFIVVWASLNIGKSPFFIQQQYYNNYQIMLQRKCFTSPRQRRILQRPRSPLFNKPLNQRIISKSYQQIIKQLDEPHDDERLTEQPIRLKPNSIQAKSFLCAESKSLQNWNFNLIFNPMQIILIVLIIIILFIATYFFAFSQDTCINDYQRKECWRQENNKNIQCMNLQDCMVNEEKTDYIEYLVTIGAALLLILKKYQREVIRMVCKMKQDKKS